MPETLKKLREPAALAAVVFAGLTLLVAVINLLAPPSSNGFSEPFANRAHDQVGTFLDVVVAAAAAFAVYLANHVTPALAKARLITLAALVEMGVALLFGLVTALAQFGADGIGGEGKFLTFVMAIGEGVVVVVAALFVWMTWQILNPQTARPSGQGSQYGGGWTAGPGAGTGAGQGGQQYAQPGPPPGGFGWTPQQGAGQPGQQAGQPGPAGFGQQPGQSGPTAFGQQSQGQGQSAGAAGAPQPFGSDRTQLLPPVQGGQPQGQSQPGGYEQHQQSQPFGQAASPSGTGSHQPQPQPQPPVPPTMQDYAAAQNPWSPSGVGGSTPQPGAQNPAHGQGLGQGQAQGQGQQIPSARADEAEPRQGPFQIGDWRSE
ncbi:hypothetical protein [Actinocrinis sp.]|uniref:hypothetical protein n=1 Tax=Actinocrinis sp. TaxID=1920516 RepID=UPI002D3DAE44|nr:hypothetical protein [Actinocrinis sp.]HZP50044.1 hypothetical protein [Actinocrinis sp.]